MELYAFKKNSLVETISLQVIVLLPLHISSLVGAYMISVRFFSILD